MQTVDETVCYLQKTRCDLFSNPPGHQCPPCGHHKALPTWLSQNSPSHDPPQCPQTSDWFSQCGWLLVPCVLKHNTQRGGTPGCDLIFPGEEGNIYLYASFVLAYSMSSVLFSLVGHVTYWDLKWQQINKCEKKN